MITIFLALLLSTPGHASPQPGAFVSEARSLAPTTAAQDDEAVDWRPVPIRRKQPNVSYSSVPVIDIGSGGGRPSHPGSGGGPTVGGGSNPAGGSYRGPGDMVGGGNVGTGGSGPGPSTGGSGGGGGTRSPTGGAVPGPGPTVPTGSSSLPNPVTLTTTLDDTWWLWWEYNKNEYLKPNRLSLVGLATTGDDPEDRVRLAIENARTGAFPLFVAASKDADATVRGAAVVALGRVGGARAIEALIARLDDANQDVRHQAILALGATGADEAIDPLLAIARSGSLDGDERRRISPFARPLAIVALGLGRRHDYDDRVDVEIVKILQNRTRSNREEIGTAALVYATLVPSAEMERYALTMAKDDTEAPGVRCRAIESLRNTRNPETVEELCRFLVDGRMDLRRSAALALGEVRLPRALSALITASESETEPLTRGFVVVAIGHQGGETAQAHLTRLLEKGEAAQRRWAALALGIEARRAVDAEQAQRLAAHIRAAREREKSHEGEGAFAIALGLARDAASRPWIQKLLAEGADPRQRMYAASALALLGTAEDAAVLRARLAVETRPVARVAIADALGVLGHAADVPAMLDVLMKLNEPAMQGLAASAMAAHGTREALVALDTVARIEEGSQVRRSAALAGLGMILAGNPPLTLAEVSRESNYTVFSEWIGGMFQSTL